MDSVLDYLVQGLKQSVLMAYAVWWALVFGFLISAIVQAWVPRQKIENALSGSGARPIALATGLGAASSSCSYAAIAIAKSLFQKGASAASALAFQFASTNLVWELGLVLWVLIGWQFTLAEYVGGIVMIVIMTILLRLFVSPQLEEIARGHAQNADAGHQHHPAATEKLTWRQRVTRADSWSDVAHNFRGDWQMLYKEITIGFFLAGFIGLLGNGFFNALFIRHAAAVLWSGGISFGGVIAFLFADLIVLPIIVAYRKYYGTSFAMRITALMFVTMVIAALIINAVFGGLGVIPTGARPSRGDIFGSIRPDYKLALNIVGVVIFAILFWLTTRRGVTDPVCGMKVDREKAVTKEFRGETFYFCSNHCLHAFEADPDKYLRGTTLPDHVDAAHAHH